MGWGGPRGPCLNTLTQETSIATGVCPGRLLNTTKKGCQQGIGKVLCLGVGVIRLEPLKMNSILHQMTVPTAS